MTDKWVFIFSSGATILIEAETKEEAIEKVKTEYENLFYLDFEVRRVVN